MCWRRKMMKQVTQQCALFRPVVDPTPDGLVKVVRRKTRNSKPSQPYKLTRLPQSEMFSQSSNQELSKLLGWNSTKLLTGLSVNKLRHYSILKIPKKNGKTRTLHNPDQFMRVAQYQILKNILEKVEIPEYIHAFEKKKTIPGMAAQHVPKGGVISVDLKDFFGSIKQYMVEEIFQIMGFGEKSARTLSELCTYKTFVPQGALTSPKLSNIVSAMTFGPPLKEYCDSISAALTIYADDVTVSLGDARAELITQIQDRILETVNLFGFKVNFEKQKVMYSSSRQYVCGVVVNEKVNLMKKERLKLMAIVHND